MKIQVELSVRDGFEPRTVMAQPVETEGLAVFKDDTPVEAEKKRKFPWTLVHIPSGMGVALTRTKKDAVELSRRLNGACDWTLPAEEIATWELRDKVKVQTFELSAVCE